MIYRQIEQSMPAGLLTPADSQAIERMAVAWARFRECQRKIATLTMFTRGLVGQLTISPLVRTQNLAAKEMNLAGEALGLSPVARARISAPDSVDDAPMALLVLRRIYQLVTPRTPAGKRFKVVK